MTGDLVDDGNERQYRQLRDKVLSPLLPRFYVLAAPGNHDYAWAGNKLIRGAIRRYRQYVSATIYPGNVAAKPYPRGAVDHQERVVFLGLDSADPQGVDWFAEGVVGKKQRKRLDVHLRAFSGYFKIVFLHHHPFDRRLFVCLREADRLLRVMSKRADLVLFGHKHASEEFQDLHGIPLMLASGKVTEPVRRVLSFRVVEIDSGRVVGVHTEEIAAVS